MQVQHTIRTASILLCLGIALSLPQLAVAAGDVTSVTTHTELSTPFRYSIGEDTYTWGMGHNEILDSFTYRGNSFSQVGNADEVAVRRVDRAGVTTGRPCSVFGERAADFTQLLPSFPADDSGSGNCDIAEMLTGRIINRGVLDVFSNVEPEPSSFNPEPKNIERIDFLFTQGVVAPLQSRLLEQAGHLASEKRGNNGVQIAAILALDESGQPSNYGPLVRVNPFGCSDPDICYGVTPLSHNYSFFTSTALAPQGFPVHMKDSTESVAMAFISLGKLGIGAGQRYYGFSYFPRDVDPALHTLTDPSTFPADTADNDGPGDGADIYGGMSAYYMAGNFIEDGGSVVNASVFVDANNDGIRDEGEAGVEAVTLTLFEDSNNNGVLDPGIDLQAGEILSTNSAGIVFVPGVPDGDYFLLLDETDPDLPPGLELPAGSNPVLLTAPMAPGSTINFAFVQSDGSPGDGLSPIASDDAFNISQGVPQSLDVLANDSNPGGGQLTIIDVTGVSSGAATVIDGQIYYEPDPDFIGSTAFLYVVENVSGRQDSAMVTLSVARFSDINNNLLNDFDECGCTDLSLITGIHGSGVGALSGSIVLWSGALWYRRRKCIAVGARR